MKGSLGDGAGSVAIRPPSFERPPCQMALCQQQPVARGARQPCPTCASRRVWFDGQFWQCWEREPGPERSVIWLELNGPAKR